MKKTLKYLKPYSGTVAAGLGLKFIGSVAELFLPQLLGTIIDDVAANDALSSGQKLKFTLILGGIMLLCAAVALLGNIFANRLTVISSGKMTHDLRYDLFTKTTHLQSRQVDSVGIPSLISRLTSDSYYVNQMVARTLRLGVRAPILILGGMILAFSEDTVLALVLLACVPVIGTSVFLITRQSVPLYFSVQKKQDEMVRRTQENVSGVRAIKALNRSAFEAEKFDGLTKDLAAAEFKANKIMSLSNPLATLTLNLGLVVLIFVGALRANSAGTVLEFLQFFVIILNAMIALTKIFVVISRGTASAERIERILEMDTEEKVLSLPEEDDSVAIRFENVSFSYNGVEDNLKNLDFTLKHGQTLGIIGPTGSGKSTIVNLLLHFYDVGQGRILIDGRDLRSYPKRELCEKFGVVFQSDFLYASTLRENVDFGRGLSDEQILRALENAQATEFVKSHGGLDFVLSQKADNLSGGQKQRLLIARALANEPEILVLDDSSSALDFETDAALRRALSREYSASTKVIIAQRVSSIRHADLILVLEDGNVIGKGTHEELVSSCEEYALIYRTQMGAEGGEAV